MSDDIEMEVNRLATDFVEERIAQVAKTLVGLHCELKDHYFSLTEADLLVVQRPEDPPLNTTVVAAHVSKFPFVSHTRVCLIPSHPRWYWIWFNFEGQEKDLPRGGRCDIVLAADGELRFDPKMTAWREHCAEHGLDPYATKRPDVN